MSLSLNNMTKIYKVVAMTMSIFVIGSLSGQDFELLLQKSIAMQETQLCYEIQLNNYSGDAVHIAAQNYRLYYDASVVQFDRQETFSLLPGTGYSSLKVKQAVHNSNASGFGGLEFGATLGYINLAISENMQVDQLTVSTQGSTLPLAVLCFENLDPAREPAIIWARAPLTSGYSSAYTTLAINKEGQTSLMSNLIFTDLDASKPTDMEKMVGVGTGSSKR